jgi:hypothetical protein
MSFNKLNNLIEKYNLSNVIKVSIILVVLYLVARVFIPNSLISNMIPEIVENFDNLNNGTIYGNELSLNEPKNTPTYFNNTCVLSLAGVHRIDTLKFMFNTNANTINDSISGYTSNTPIFIHFKDGNGNMRNITTSSHTDSPPDFSTNVASDMSLTLNSITDENGAAIYTSQIVLTIGDSSNNISTFTDNNGNGYISNFGIYGGERKLPTLSDYTTLSTTLTNTQFSQKTQQSSTPTQTNNTINTYTFSNGNNMILYSMQLNITQTTISTSEKFTTTDSPFNIKITYSNTLYPSNNFPISKTYIIRSDSNKLTGVTGATNSFIFLVDPIIANSIIFSIANVNNINDNSNPPGFQTLTINSISVLGKNPSALDISDYKKNVNSALNSIESTDQNGNICPNINELVDKQNKTQQICDNLEYQDKTKSEKLRLERNKQYLLKLKNQQEQIDQLNNVIQSLETQRENRAATSDKVRVLQYQKQAGDASTIRDLANQRLESQANNKLFLDVKVNTN